MEDVHSCDVVGIREKKEQDVSKRALQPSKTVYHYRLKQHPLW